MLKKLASTPYVLWMAIFVVVPLGMMIYFAFTTSDGSFTLNNMLQIDKYTSIFLKSINLAVIATLICFLLAFPAGYLLSRMKTRRQNMMLLLIMLPMWMNFLLRTYAWMTLLENEGLINHFLELLGIGPLSMINTQGAVVLGMVYNFLPFMILPLYSVMAKIDPSLFEAAADLGCNPMLSIWKVLIPLSRPGIISGITMVFVPSVSTFIISRMLGGGQNMLIGDLIEKQFIGSSYNPYTGSAMSLVLMVLMILVMAAIGSFEDDEMEGIVV